MTKENKIKELERQMVFMSLWHGFRITNFRAELVKFRVYGHPGGETFPQVFVAMDEDGVNRRSSHAWWECADTALIFGIAKSIPDALRQFTDSLNGIIIQALAITDEMAGSERKAEPC